MEARPAMPPQATCVIGTAGHVDHGKTSLVRALTGVDTDRLREEKERGITIELGFAAFDWKGHRAAIVDVPGHERFIKTMVAGAHGLDFVCLVVAADEGVMPQTREHLDICQLLGVQDGLVVLTKRDLVDDEWLDTVEEATREALSGTFLETATYLAVSAETGQGLDELRRELGTRIASPRKREKRVARLPVDRVFTKKGFGTVATGTLLGANLRVGEEVEILPSGARGKIRGLQQHSSDVDVALPGSRCAINLAGLDLDQVKRGNIVARPDTVIPAHILDGRFTLVTAANKPLKSREKILLHHATRQIPATLDLVDTQQLAPGDTAFVQIRVSHETPVAAVPGDRFLVRGFAPQKHYGTTLGGGEILRIHAPKVRRNQEASARDLAQLDGAPLARALAGEVRRRGPKGIAEDELAQQLGLPAEQLRTALNQLVQSGEILRANASPPLFCHRDTANDLVSRVVDLVKGEMSDTGGVTPAELRSKLPRTLPGPLFELLLLLVHDHPDIEMESDRFSAKGQGLAPELTRETKRLAECYREWGTQPAKTRDVEEQGEAPKQTTKRALRQLIDDGTLIRVSKDLLFHREAIETLREALNSHFESAKELTPTQWKGIVGASRKYTIPLAEYFDAQRLTLRVAEVRVRRSA